jgi:hypothetical protein
MRSPPSLSKFDAATQSPLIMAGLLETRAFDAPLTANQWAQ